MSIHVTYFVNKCSRIEAEYYEGRQASHATAADPRPWQAGLLDNFMPLSKDERVPGAGPDTKLTEAKVASPALAAAVRRSYGAETVGDLLRCFPRRYEDRSAFTPMADVRPGDTVTVRGAIVAVQNSSARSRLVITRVEISDGSGSMHLAFFNQWYMKKRFEKLIGEQIITYGRAALTRGNAMELTDVEWEADEEDALAVNRIVPIYPLTEGLRQNRIRRLMWDVLARFGNVVAEVLPASVLRQHRLLGAIPATRGIHYPSSFEELQASRLRFAFEELFLLQTTLVCRRAEVKSQRGFEFKAIDAPLQELLSALPFTLTDAQARVVREMAADMQQTYPMNRLVHGDVGSGKTVVAMAALVIAARNDFQAALMAPTEILAEQHYAGISRVLGELGINVELITGSLPKKERDLRTGRIARGESAIAIGTHALIEDGVAFARLGLAIVDEQHRFGVLQRAALGAKGELPDVLVMTATPIPRTLTLTVYGDLDVSTIDELPPGRKVIRTHWLNGPRRMEAYDRMRGLLAKGRQAYIICPMVAESEKVQARAATDLAARLATDVYPEFRVGLLHGQMKSADKEQVMTQFANGGLDVLVATTVIEVGVDVPNASIIIIEDAERFGLAQLHQLRGRVGRGNVQSYCVLLGDPRTQEGRARLEVMTATNDGFQIAEKDLALRGPGDFLGVRQSGINIAPFADFFGDGHLLGIARSAAVKLVEEDPALASPENRAVGAAVRRRLISGARTN